MQKQNRITHFLYVPFTGLGLYSGWRGSRWLRNRIKIFKQFVLPSLVAQTNKNFILWVSVRYDDKNNSLIREFREFLESIPDFKTVFTYAGVCFYDDKYSDEIANNRLIESIHGSMGELLNIMGECDEVLMTIQPSDDCYYYNAVQEIQDFFLKYKNIHVFGYLKGYVMDYIARQLAEWNPTTTPPFYTIRFPREIFVDPFKHIKHIGPYKSHEYVKNYLPAYYTDYRGFIVGTHGENISTIFNHPFAGNKFLGDNLERILNDFGLEKVMPLKIKISFRKMIMRHSPHGWQRKLRCWFGERFYAKLYEFLRS